MLKLGKLSDWVFVEPGQEMTFDQETPRRVKIEIRTEVRETVMIDSGDGPGFFCVVELYENVEFYAEGPFALTAEGPMYIRTADSIRLGMANADDEIFTRMHDRPPIAPEIAAMQRIMARNMETMRAQMKRDVAGMMRSTERENRRRAVAAEAARAADPDPAGEGAAGNKQPSGTGSKAGTDPKPAEPNNGKKD